MCGSYSSPYKESIFSLGLVLIVLLFPLPKELFNSRPKIGDILENYKHQSKNRVSYKKKNTDVDFGPYVPFCDAMRRRAAKLGNSFFFKKQNHVFPYLRGNLFAY